MAAKPSVVLHTSWRGRLTTTVAPLVLFALAARRLKFSTLGFLQYIGPTGQFILGLYYGEPFTLFHAVCFGLIWTALAIFSLDAVRRSRRMRAA